jgi:hypothetical protein
MYTGTLIESLMKTVERVEKKLAEKRIDAELHEIFTMQIAVNHGNDILMGAA